MGLEVLRSAARAFRRSPTPLLVAVVTLSIGIAVNLTIFALVSAVLLRPLPFPHSSELIVLRIAGIGLSPKKQSRRSTCLASRFRWRGAAIFFSRLVAHRLLPTRLQAPYGRWIHR
jgi:hypothetical protein